MESKKQRNSVNSIIKQVHVKWEELCKEYKVSPSCAFYILDASDIFDYNIPAIAKEKFSSTIMTTWGKHIAKNDIIFELHIVVLANYTEIITSFIDYDLDVKLTMNHLENVMRHEIGHVLHYMSYLGESLNEWIKMNEESNDIKDSLPKVRNNASYKSMLEGICAYHSIPMERIADEFAGLTIKTWVTDFVLANPGVSRKKLGVEEYLTEEEFSEVRRISLNS